MNIYSHELMHNQQANELKANAEQYRLGQQLQKGVQPSHKGLIASLGGQLIRVGKRMQNYSDQ